ncbi:MAG TPA: methylated-DNA--[protein]-cysteine S-methyltransferase [Dehalococcoidia bacterium]|nr:methylated-DNA--[protein]-cysteine S-methyltransferase [Dehalococcoidia bacterium]
MNARTVLDSPIGPLYLEASAVGLRRLAFGTGRKFPTAQAFEDGAVHPAAAEVLARAAGQLREYFEGTRKEFDLPLDIEGTSFQKRVWQAIAAIPYAESISYKRLAEEAGAPGAYRAAGAACGANHVAIVVPCHRVVGSDRSLHGFGGGLPVKRWLLDHEASTVMAGAARQAVLV